MLATSITLYLAGWKSRIPAGSIQLPGIPGTPTLQPSSENIMWSQAWSSRWSSFSMVINFSPLAWPALAGEKARFVGATVSGQVQTGQASLEKQAAKGFFFFFFFSIISFQTRYLCFIWSTQISFFTQWDWKWEAKMVILRNAMKKPRDDFTLGMIGKTSTREFLQKNHFFSDSFKNPPGHWHQNQCYQLLLFVGFKTWNTEPSGLCPWSRGILRIGEPELQDPWVQKFLSFYFLTLL